MIRKTLTLTILSLFLSVPALAGTFFQWTDKDGVVNMTDDVKMIPAAYKGVAVERRFEDVKDRRTPVTISAADYQAALTASLERQRALNDRTMVNPNRLRDCTGPLTITHERRSYEERGNRYNSMFFVTRNACGDVVSVTREQPSLRVNLER